jgi:hypothetical protein
MTAELAKEQPKTILEKLADLEKEKQDRIKDLIRQREKIEVNSANELKLIAEELKALGHKRTKAPNGSKKAEKAVVAK